MQITVLSFGPTTYCPLAPAPNVTETEAIMNAMKDKQGPAITDLMAQPINVLTTYRGQMLYCEGGVCAHRVNPQTEGGNGYVSMPPNDSEEDVIISCADGLFSARVRFG
jgi:hypothetical protein